MKQKFSSMGRVAIALVLALSLSLVMAVPVAAQVTGEITVTPTEADPAYVSPGGTIDVVFSGYATTDDLVDVRILIDDGVIGDSGIYTVTAVDSAFGDTKTVAIDAGAVEGAEYDLTVMAKVGTDSWTEVTEEKAVIVDSIAPTILDISGTTYQNGRDAIVITFSETVVADSGWDATDFSAFESPVDTPLTLDSAGFDQVTTVLTITLADAVCLTNGDYIKVTPATDKIKDLAGNSLDDTAETSAAPVSGDVVAPTVRLAYDPDRPVRDADGSLTITATFSEAMADTPQIAIDTQGTDLEATDMAGSDTSWTYTYNVPAASDGTATATITGKDLADNDVGAHTDNTFEIDNTLPTIAVADIVGTTIPDDDDTIVITFFEAVTAEDTTLSDNEFTSILSGTRTLTFASATFALDDADTVLTITLLEDDAYLINGETITVELSDTGGQAILDAALNKMLSGSENEIVGTTEVTGDLTPPTITRIVGESTDLIYITFSELVVAADGTWSANEFSIESPAGAPLNINHASFTPPTAAGTVLEIELDIADAAVLVEGEVVCVTPTADAVVDLAGNPLAADEVDSGADSGWLEAWVDGDWSDQATVDASDPSLIWTTNAWGAIQDGIDAVAEGGTVHVLPGTYTLADDTPLLIETAGLTLRSTGTAAETTIIANAVDGGTPQNGVGILVNAADVTVEGFTVTIAGAPSTAIYLLNAENAIIQDNIITSITSGGGIDVSLAATGVRISGNELNEFCSMWVHGSPCMMSGNNIFGRDVIVQPVGSATLEVTITDNTFPDPGEETVNGAINLWGGGVGSTITGLIERNDLSNRDQAGLRIGSNNPNNLTIENLTATGNDITNNDVAGTKIYDGVTWGDGNVINNNNITGNAAGILNETDVEVDATDNWWGDANGPTHASNPDGGGDVVSNNVTYSPWLDASYPYGKSITTTGHFTIDLVEGWNLISLPLIPADSDIDAVLADLEAQGSVIEVRAFLWEAGEPGQQFWLPATSSLDLMEDGWGYWINMSEADALVVTGSEFPDAGGMQPSYNVYEGWNLIGFKALAEERTVVDYLGTAIAGSWSADATPLLVVPGIVQAMYSYNAADGVYELVRIPSVGEVITKLVPGQGYWLAVSADGTIYP